jgi:hypothetical protein
MWGWAGRPCVIHASRVGILSRVYQLMLSPIGESLSRRQEGPIYYIQKHVTHCHGLTHHDQLIRLIYCLDYRKQVNL